MTSRLILCIASRDNETLALKDLSLACRLYPCPQYTSVLFTTIVSHNWKSIFPVRRYYTSRQLVRGVPVLDITCPVPVMCAFSVHLPWRPWHPRHDGVIPDNYSLSVQRGARDRKWYHSGNCYTCLTKNKAYWLGNNTGGKPGCEKGGIRVGMGASWTAFVKWCVFKLPCRIFIRLQRCKHIGMNC